MPVQISEAAQRGIITTDTAIGTGIGIALVDAVLEGDREQVERIHELFPAFELVSAAAAVERSALALTGLFSRDFVFSLHDAHRQTLNYRAFVLRRRDRFGSGSAAVRFARHHAQRQLQMYLRAVAVPAPAVPRQPARPSSGGGALAGVFGAGYATALSLTHIAAETERHHDELLAELRACIAAERVLPPEVRPPA